MALAGLAGNGVTTTVKSGESEVAQFGVGSITKQHFSYEQEGAEFMGARIRFDDNKNSRTKTEVLATGYMFAKAVLRDLIGLTETLVTLEKEAAAFSALRDYGFPSKIQNHPSMTETIQAIFGENPKVKKERYQEKITDQLNGLKGHIVKLSSFFSALPQPGDKETLLAGVITLQVKYTENPPTLTTAQLHKKLDTLHKNLIRAEMEEQPIQIPTGNDKQFVIGSKILELSSPTVVHDAVSFLLDPTTRFALNNDLNRDIIEGELKLLLRTLQAKQIIHDLSIPNEKDLTPMKQALRSGLLELVETLAEYNPKLLLAPETFPPVCEAAKHGHLATVQFLYENREKYKIKFTDNDKNRDVVTIACMYGQPDVVRYLIQVGVVKEHLSNNHREGNCIYFAALNGHDAVLKVLQESDISMDTPMSLKPRGVKQAPSCFMSLVSKESGSKVARDKYVKSLLDHGADVNMVGMESRLTLLEQACILESKKTVKLLIRKKANMKDAIKYALQVGNLSIIKVFLDNGYPVNDPVDPEDSQALHLLAGCKSPNLEAILQALLDKGADLNGKDAKGRTPVEHSKIKGNEPFYKLLTAHANKLKSSAKEKSKKDAAPVKTQSAAKTPPPKDIPKAEVPPRAQQASQGAPAAIPPQQQEVSQDIPAAIPLPQEPSQGAPIAIPRQQESSQDFPTAIPPKQEQEVMGESRVDLPTSQESLSPSAIMASPIDSSGSKLPWFLTAAVGFVTAGLCYKKNRPRASQPVLGDPAQNGNVAGVPKSLHLPKGPEPKRGSLPPAKREKKRDFEQPKVENPEQKRGPDRGQVAGASLASGMGLGLAGFQDDNEDGWEEAPKSKNKKKKNKKHPNKAKLPASASAPGDQKQSAPSRKDLDLKIKPPASASAPADEKRPTPSVVDSVKEAVPQGSVPVAPGSAAHLGNFASPVSGVQPQQDPMNDRVQPPGGLVVDPGKPPGGLSLS